MVELAVEHLSGKEAMELPRKRSGRGALPSCTNPVAFDGTGDLLTKSPHTIVQWYAGFLSYSTPLVQGDELLKRGHRLIGEDG